MNQTTEIGTRVLFFHRKFVLFLCSTLEVREKKNLFSAARPYKFNVTTIKSRKIRILETFSFGICADTNENRIFSLKKNC